MAIIALKGKPISTVGELPGKGMTAPDFSLTKNDLSDLRLADFAGKVKILNIVPSLDTGVCAASVSVCAKIKESNRDTVFMVFIPLNFSIKKSRAGPPQNSGPR